MKPRTRHLWLAVAAAGCGVVGATSSLDAQCRVADVGSASVNFCIGGSGAPTIVLAAGAGMSSSTWSTLTADLAEMGTVVSFDRPGFGLSPEGDLPRSPDRISKELVSLLELAQLPEPFVFVGHSMGGIHVAMAAALVPTRSAAVVLLDTPHPSFEARRLELLNPQQRRDRARTLEQGRAVAPAVTRHERAAATAQLLPITPNLLRSTPLVVVAADSQNFGPHQPQAHRELWLELSSELLLLSNDAHFVVAEGSGHMIHIDRPDLFLGILRDFTSPHR